MIELKNCPFCGGRAAFSKDGIQKTKYGNEQIYCTDCFITAAPEDNEADAAERWNDRPSGWTLTNGEFNLPTVDGKKYLVALLNTRTTEVSYDLRKFEDGWFTGAIYSHIPIIAWLEVPFFDYKIERQNTVARRLQTVLPKHDLSDCVKQEVEGNG